MTKDLSVTEIEQHNNRKLTADKIRQILSKVMETPTQSSKRWVWELMQNAKDVPNKFNKVSIKIELTENSLTFQHNGNPFSLENIMGLIQQVSSKNSTNNDNEVTGKFGTGFISTHLLSKRISVKGIVLYKSCYRKFDILLDRDGNSSEDLIPKIDCALTHINEIENNNIFPIVENYEKNRSETSFDTSFQYELINDNSKKWANDGIADLVNTLPQTLVNLPKIKQVIVIHQDKEIIYQKQEVFKSDNVTAYEVTITNQESKRFLTHCEDNITLAVEVSTFEPITLIEHFGKQPNLFRDFPLIGSEKFYFPYILNGHTFNPTEDRDSIVLHSEESKEAIDNRQSIEHAITVAQKFTQWLIENEAINRYICAYTRRPELKSTWEDFSKNWYTNIQEDWQKQLIELPLVETEEGSIIQLKNAIIPEDGNTKELKEEFYILSKPIFSSKRIPNEKNYFNWLKVCSDKNNSWNVELTKNAKNLAEVINNFGDKKTLLDNSELENTEQLHKWLNNFYDYLIKTQQENLFSEYNLIPNQYGTFNTLDDLYLEYYQKPIANELLDILKQLGQDWRNILIDRNIKLNININSKDCSDISNCINEILKEEQGNFEIQDVLVNILKLQSINSTDDNFQYKVFHFGRDLFGFKDKIKHIDNISDFNFNPALKLFITLIHQKIEELETIDNLQQQLDKTTEEDTLFWLNNYLNLIQEKSDYKYLLEANIGIIPNRYKQFISFDYVKAFGTEETPLDDELVDILLLLNKQDDWKEFLVHDGIYLDFKEKCKFEELSQCIEENIEKIEHHNRLENYREPVLSLIEWTENNTNKNLAELYFKGFLKNSKSLFFKLTVGDSNIGLSTIKMLQDEKNVNLLSKIQESNIPIEKISELIDTLTDNSLDDILKNDLKEIIAEKENRENLYKVGEKVEEAIKYTLEQTLPKCTVEKVSKGQFDLRISYGKKSYFLEVKSFKYGSTLPLLFSPNQVKRVMQNENNYAICILERPQGEREITIEYIQENLQFAKNLVVDFKEGFKDFEQYEKIINSNNTSKLEIKILGNIRIAVNKSAILNKAKDLESLMRDIKAELAE